MFKKRFIAKKYLSMNNHVWKLRHFSPIFMNTEKKGSQILRFQLFMEKTEFKLLN